METVKRAPADGQAIVPDRGLPAVLAILTGLTVVLTWPQALHLTTQIASHDDPLLSLWRLSWITHALTGNIRHLFDGNIFYPHTGTLAYTDATLLEGLIAAPWLAAHVNPLLVYNVLLLGGIICSGLGMFVLVRHLTSNTDAALISAVIFTLAPYRIEHFMHLELQWTMWMPLAFWAVHRLFETGSIRFGVLTGALLLLQILSCVYYGVFLGMMVAALVLMLAAGHRGRLRRVSWALCIGALLPAVLVAAYAQPYLANARELGPRTPGEVATFSAQLTSYVAAPEQNWLWGWTSFQFTGNELHLFPGLVALLLSTLALKQPQRRMVWIYAALAAIAVTLSLGMHGPIYRWLYAHTTFLAGFRAPARFGILACCGLAVLAGFGFDALQQRIPAGRASRALVATTVALVAIEGWSAPLQLMEVPSPSADVYKLLQKAYPSVVIEFPLIGWDLTPQVMYWSTQHWNPLVNGYSGYHPRSYLDTLHRMETFPDDEAIRWLQRLGVRYILVHEFFYKAEERSALMLKLAGRSELIPTGRYRGPVGTVQVFELRTPAAGGATKDGR